MTAWRGSAGNCLVAAVAVAAVGGLARGGEAAGPGQACSVDIAGHRVALRGPAFTFVLDTASSLRAVSWKNRLSGRTLDLGSGLEVDFDIGLPGRRLTTPALRVAKATATAEGARGEATFELTADDPETAVTVTYRWDGQQPVLHKIVDIANRGETAWDRLLHVRLGAYDTGGVGVTDRPASSGQSVNVPRQFPTPGNTDVERGFPAYVADEFFLTLAHPSGVAEAAAGRVALRQYPGARLQPGEAFRSMEAVYGVAAHGQARHAFLDHLTRRMRRVQRGHDRPYAIFEPFGARPNGSFDETEEFVLDSIGKVAQGQRDSGCHFDLYSVDFWVDYRGTLKECDPRRFPNGLKRIRGELDKLGTALGLWIDSSWEAWSIGGNPQVQACLNVDPERPETVRGRSWGRKSFCRATEPVRSMYTDAFRYHIRAHGVRLIKFDNLAADCVNPRHEHLPGIYSNEPIFDAVIEFLRALDAECPDVLLMLYWGYRSPWWLLDGDTLFDSGLGIEAASPSTLPAPYVRASVVQKLDQAQWHASDVPTLGKDSLGVWLSDWAWNSQIGKERWQEGIVMDLCRGSLLAQPWSDTPWLTPPERRQMAEFIALLKARPECFRQPRFVVGNPQRDEPYGYCCTDGKFAVIALHNCSWRDRAVTLQLNPAWGLPRGQAWDLYRWYPQPAQLVDASGGIGDAVVLNLRPFQVMLIEAVPAGEPAALPRRFESRPVTADFKVPSRAVAVDVRPAGEKLDAQTDAARRALRPEETAFVGQSRPAAITVELRRPDQQHGPERLLVRGEAPASPAGGLLVVTVSMSRDGKVWEQRNIGERVSADGALDGKPANWQPVLGRKTYPSCWQAWRLQLEPAPEPRPFTLTVTPPAADGAALAVEAHFVPR